MKMKMGMDVKRNILIGLLIVVDVAVFFATRVIGSWYGKIGPSELVNGIILYFFLIKRKYWAYICFYIFTVMGAVIAGTSIVSHILFPDIITAPLFGYASMVSAVAYIFTLRVGKKMLEEETNAKVKKRNKTKKK